MRFGRVAALLTVSLAAQGCLLFTGGPYPTGSVVFQWSFEGETDCGIANVKEVVVTVRRIQSTGNNYGPRGKLCGDGGLELTDLREGEYVLTLDGVQDIGDQQAVILYTTERSFTVVGGGATNLGILDLKDQGGQSGEVLFDWTFQKVAGGTTPNCAEAGVNTIHAIINTPDGSEIFNDAVDCLDAPTSVINIPPGDYLLTLEGVGSYGNFPIVLYQALNVGVTIKGGRVSVGSPGTELEFAL